MTPVVIMAGGRGERLRSLTDKRPKPMLKVGGKPILEEIIDGFAAQGFRKFWLCVNYKRELIEDYFGNGESRGLKIKYTHEAEPLGTAGPLRLLPKFDIPFIVSNSDVLARLSYGELMEFHARSNADITITLGLHQYQVPYGVAEFDNGEFVGLREKPIQNIPVNGGIYVLEPRMTAKIPQGKFDMPDLVGLAEKTAAYPIQGYWTDVGHFEDLARANTEW